MNFAEYQPLARRTLKELDYRGHMTHMGLGVIGEFGELCDAVKKHVIYGKDLDFVNVMEEAGDVLWYVVGYATELKVSTAVLDLAFLAGYESAETDGLADGELLILLSAIVSTGAMRLLVPVMDEMPQQIQPDSQEARDILGLMASCVGTVCMRFDLDLSEILERNIAKLRKRYGDKFSDVAALSRDLVGERAVLEAPKPAPVDEGGYPPLMQDRQPWPFPADGNEAEAAGN